MVDDGKRNFRVAYYDKVGFRGIGEKALSTILKDDVVDKKKLENFCIRCSVQASFRLLIWKVLLDVLPLHQQSHKFVMAQREEQYQDLHHALEVIRIIDDATPQPDVYLRMFLLEQGELCTQIVPSNAHDVFLVIADAVLDMVDSPVDGYWITVGMFKLFERSNFSACKEFDSILSSVIKRGNSKLYAHLEQFHFFPCDVTSKWHHRGFAGVVNAEGCLENIWDIILGRGSRILPYVSAHILLAFERSLLMASSLRQCLEVIKKTPFSEEVSDFACHKAIESWKKYENII